MISATTLMTFSQIVDGITLSSDELRPLPQIISTFRPLPQINQLSYSDNFRKNWSVIKPVNPNQQLTSLELEVAKIAYHYDKIRCSVQGCRTTYRPCQSFSPDYHPKQYQDYNHFVAFFGWCKQRKYNIGRYLNAMRNMAPFPTPDQLMSDAAKNTYHKYVRLVKSTCKTELELEAAETPPQDYIEKVINAIKISKKSIIQYIKALFKSTDSNDKITIKEIFLRIIQAPEGLINGQALQAICGYMANAYNTETNQNAFAVAGFNLCPMSEMAVFITFKELFVDLHNWLEENRLLLINQRESTEKLQKDIRNRRKMVDKYGYLFGDIEITNPSQLMILENYLETTSKDQAKSYQLLDDAINEQIMFRGVLNPGGVLFKSDNNIKSPPKITEDQLFYRQNNDILTN